MNAVRNSVELVGHLGKRPEVKHLEGGKVVANFSLATSEFFTTREGEKRQETQWHNIVTWGKTALLAEESLDKGSEVSVKGKLVYRTYEDKQGVKRYVTEVIADQLSLVEKSQ